ncbi:MAG: hypothetical protein Q9184_003744 [Pyrenodesmia sp. 2 TL-2023]
MNGGTKVKTEPGEHSPSIKTEPREKSSLIKKEPSESPEEVETSFCTEEELAVRRTGYDDWQAKPIEHHKEALASFVKKTLKDDGAFMKCSPEEQKDMVCYLVTMFRDRFEYPDTTIGNLHRSIDALAEEHQPHQRRFPGPLPVTPAPGREYLQGYVDLLSHGFEILSESIREGKTVDIADYNKLHDEWMTERKKHGL